MIKRQIVYTCKYVLMQTPVWVPWTSRYWTRMATRTQPDRLSLRRLMESGWSNTPPLLQDSIPLMSSSLENPFQTVLLESWSPQVCFVYWLIFCVLPEWQVSLYLYIGFSLSVHFAILLIVILIDITTHDKLLLCLILQLKISTYLLIVSIDLNN